MSNFLGREFDEVSTENEKARYLYHQNFCNGQGFTNILNNSLQTSAKPPDLKNLLADILSILYCLYY